MPVNKRYNFKKILQAVVWSLFGMATAMLLVAAAYKKNNDHCTAVQINIDGARENIFIDKQDVNNMLNRMSFGNLKVRPLHTFNLAGMEAALEKNEWIKSAELYFDNNDVLKINIVEREPVARIFSSAGTSFYIDSSLKKLPLSNKFSARLPVFTNYPFMSYTVSKENNELLNDIKNLSSYIISNPFWMAQIEQIDITPDRTFEMIPKLGNQLIIFGNADNYQEKFNKLLIFYKNVESKLGWNKYVKINVSYKDEIVAVRRGAEDIKSDSLKTVQLLKELAANAQKQANDTLNNTQLVQLKEDNTFPAPQSHDENTDEQPIMNNTAVLNKTNSNLLKPAAVANYSPSPDTSSSYIKNNTAIKSSGTKPISNEKQNLSIEKKAVKKLIKKEILPAPHKQPKNIMQPKNEY